VSIDDEGFLFLVRRRLLLERNKLVSAIITVLIAVPLYSFVLWKLGMSFARVLIIIVLSLIFVSIPILSALGLLGIIKNRTGVKKQPLVTRVLVMFFLSPLLVGLMVFLAYPNTFITVPLSIFVMVAASLFFFITK